MSLAELSPRIRAMATSQGDPPLASQAGLQVRRPNATDTPSPGWPTISQYVASQITGEILRGDLRPGERLPTEAKLGEILGVSRSVVRDAVRTLAARGLVTVRQGTGTVVASPTDAAY